MSAPAEARGTVKRDFLKSIERDAQARWQREGAFERDAPALSQDGAQAAPEKFMATFPYPYMNGKLHLGHAFSASKAEFAIAFERTCGKRTLFPFGFHCTGMPIKASADKLRKEMEAYGCPPVLPESDAASSADSKGQVAKHSKVAAKTGAAKLQWDIMVQLGIDPEIIPKFADPAYWMVYFPPLAQQDLTSVGMQIDWRRSFITTDKNPFYDAFIRWQFNKLRAQNRIKYGKRNTIYSPLDGQACLDHDRQSGEGVEPKEYTMIKLTIKEWPASSKFDAVRSLTGYLGAATLRPETMCGQTNCWVGPDIEYGAFKASATEVVVCTRRAAMNMAFQGILAEEGKVELLAVFTGADLIGTPLRAPMSAMETVHVLPMFSVSAGKGTGIVTSVPSNSPDDFVALAELRDKPALRQKFGIPDSLVTGLQPIPIISSEAYGECGAATVVAQLGIKSQNDSVALEKAKEILYKDDFYAGKMTAGPYSGLPVQEAKPLIRNDLIQAGQACPYLEPEGIVISRSGDECVVALIDQWYIDYGEPSWRREAERCLERMNVFSDEVRNQFLGTLDWMKQWACSRSFGLGSKLPWDPTYLIESLSDSTIYMAYYSVSHILHEGSLDGSVRPNGIAPEDMTDAVWEWIFSPDGAEAASLPTTAISKELLERMRSEFRFWYPMDLRVSGKDLVPNHLTFLIYNHVSIFAEQFWPRAIRANGHLLLNSEKMSKSTGNFMTLEEAVAEFGADATRIALADAGDSIEDANFLKDTANMSILRLYNQIEFFQDALGPSAGALRAAKSPLLFNDRLMEAEMDKAIVATKKAYEATNYREALKSGFFELQNARDRYRDATVIHGDTGMHRDVIERFIKVQALLLNPIAPHFAQHVWEAILKLSGLAMNAPFPVPSSATVDASILAAGAYVQSVAHNLRTALQAEGRPRKAGKAAVAVDADALPNAAKIFVASTYPEWQERAIAILRGQYEENGGSFPADSLIVASLKPLMKDRANKKLIPFVMELKQRVLAGGLSALDRQLAFDESAVLSENIDYLTRSLGLLSVQTASINPSAVAAEDTSEACSELDREARRKQEGCIPGEPTAFFYRSEAI